MPADRAIFQQGHLTPLRVGQHCISLHSFKTTQMKLSLPLMLLASLPTLSHKDLESVGKRVWQNEAAGKVEGLTDWNKNEHFASMGIGHFIWYPPGPKGPFEESFPALVAYLKKEGVHLPDWLNERTECPWADRASFIADAGSTKMRQLRELLTATLSEQSAFLAQRLERALPSMLESMPAQKRAKLKANFERLGASGKGRFALIDYVNFKGEGVKPSERYNGEGWGLLQVLDAMPADGSVKDFSDAAAKVLTQRVKNSPPQRGESNWLPGWLNRVRAYADQ
jgi:hypothetical protein